MRDRVMSIIAIVLLAIVSGTSYWYAQSLHRRGDGAPARPGTPDFYVERFVLTVFDATGQPRRRMYADRLTHFAENDDVALQQARLVSLRTDQPRFEARSDTARLEETGEVLTMQGNVVIVRAGESGQPPLQVETDTLVARPEDDRYTTDSAVRVTRGASVVTAHGMDFDNIARTIAFKADVRNVLAPR
jgi:lipopolysaccharide export system protein LptC